jgi:hypothetical protein
VNTNSVATVRTACSTRYSASASRNSSSPAREAARLEPVGFLSGDRTKTRVVVLGPRFGGAIDVVAQEPIEHRVDHRAAVER